MSININEETYKPITLYDNVFSNYHISNLGNVKNSKTNRILKLDIKNGYYYVCLYNKNFKKTKFYIHKLVAYHFLEKINDTDVIDHIDRNRLNNNYSNLRFVSLRDNLCNRNKQQNATSIYKGVYYNKKRKKYIATITTNYKINYIGAFLYERDAAIAYNDYIIKNNLEYYNINIIQD